ncbi:GspE/PulE family protein [Pseudodesulfovibrio senegalensis]|uniref:Type II secretion system protein GspE n=1 Tax=Pseudodesulfovibrio senegalensis TaxID=1721087 RepID=A0A6N6N207_9BACT|nr:ATPase, T2SS/T4P/T4SS family [Pseudodesulfovibrio senegalensis]KAB1441418.1 type II secretion system protein GspE [Pseudodesulfovibrio senegalensis]
MSKTLATQLRARLNLTDEELEQLQTEARENRENLEQAATRTGLLDEPGLLELLSDLYAVPRLEVVPEGSVDPELIGAFSIGRLKELPAIPLRHDDGVLLGVCNSDGLERTGDFRFALNMDRIRPVLLPRQAILGVINNVFGSAREDSEVSDILGQTNDEDLLDAEHENIEDLLDDSSDAPFIRLVNTVLTQAVRAGASDVHIEPYKDTLRIRFRLDGVLYDKHTIDRRHHSALISRLKIMSKMNIAEKRLPQDGRIALSLGNRQVDLRVSCLPTAHGERVVLRLLEKSNRILSLGDLGLMDDDLMHMKRLSSISHGMILLTGPTGSGKTTTLYALLNRINSPDKNILTIEDPVEYQLDGVGQIQVNAKIGLTFSKGLRSIVRQDPDVVLIGEIRDKETAEIAIQAALTGHLVFSTLHTNDAPSAVTRLKDMGVEPFLLASVLRAAAAQRLVRVLCPECREAYRPDPHKLAANFGEYAHLFEGKTIYRATGCPACMETGYKGRKALYELMQMSDALKSMVLTETDSSQLAKEAVHEGMRTLKHDGCMKILQGVTTISEVLRVTNI